MHASIQTKTTHGASLTMVKAKGFSSPLWYIFNHSLTPERICTYRLRVMRPHACWPHQLFACKYEHVCDPYRARLQVLGGTQRCACIAECCSCVECAAKSRTVCVNDKLSVLTIHIGHGSRPPLPRAETASEHFVNRTCISPHI